MNSALTDLLLERMFRARRVVLWAGAVLVGSAVANRAGILTERGALLFSLISLLVILGGSLVTCFYVFRAGLREAGLTYAIGHVLLCIALAFILLIGIVVVPWLVRSDIERWRGTEGELSDD